MEKPPAPLPDDSVAAMDEQEEQTPLNMIREDSAEAVAPPEFTLGDSRRSSAARPDTLNTRECASSPQKLFTQLQ